MECIKDGSPASFLRFQYVQAAESSIIAYPNGTSKEGRASDLSAKKLSVSLTLALARHVTVTWIFRCDTR